MHSDGLVKQYAPISNQVNAEQLRVILRELEQALDKTTTGAVVELGCYIGTTSLFIRRLLDARGESSSREFHVYDSFAGLPPKTAADETVVGDQFQAGELAVSKKHFMLEFQKAGLTLPFIHKKWFGELAAGDMPTEICFAFLDGDFYESIRDSLQAVVPHLGPQATIIIDDYAREALPGVARAVQEYLPLPWRTKLMVEQNLGIIRT